MSPAETSRLRILRLIEELPETSQRELARKLGVSLGKTHYLLKALLQKGLVKVNNFRRSDNKRAYAYFLTPRGFAAKLDLTKAFLCHKEAEYQALTEEIALLRHELQIHISDRHTNVSR
jgi:EPS-associated MarR family transcriptional regulator